MVAPVNTVAPAITGTAEVGKTLSLSDGTWTDATSFAYSWFRSGIAIGGSTAATYTVTRDDLLSTIVGRVTATNVDGSTAADSAATTAIPSTLVVETGAIVDGADSYATLVEVGDYHGKNGNAAWAVATPAAQEAAARAATRYLDGEYRRRFKGQRVYPVTQPLEWPRVGVRTVDGPQQYYDVPPSFYDSAYSSFLPINAVPKRIKDAQCELALLALAGPLAANLDGSVRRQRIDVIETEYAPGKVPGKIVYQIIEQLLSDLLHSPCSSDLVRG